MSKAVYIATMEKGSGKSIVTLGLMRMLRGKVAKVGYFKPIISDLEEGEIDNHIDTFYRIFNWILNMIRPMHLQKVRCSPRCTKVK